MIGYSCEMTILPLRLLFVILAIETRVPLELDLDLEVNSLIMFLTNKCMFPLGITCEYNSNP